jgi:collagen type III alpha
MMKRTIALIPLAALIASSAYGQDSDRRRPGSPPGDGGDRSPLLAVLDFNRDGELDQREIDMAVVALRRLDRNQDGKVDAEEIKTPPARPQRGGPGGTDRPQRPGSPGGDGERPQRRGFAPDFSELDGDGDGKISKDEAPDRMKERFDQIDGNGDGFIDKAEQEALVQMMRRRFAERQGQGQRRERDADQGQGETEKPKRPPVEE